MNASACSSLSSAFMSTDDDDFVVSTPGVWNPDVGPVLIPSMPGVKLRSGNPGVTPRSKSPAFVMLPRREGSDSGTGRSVSLPVIASCRCEGPFPVSCRWDAPLNHRPARLPSTVFAGPCPFVPDVTDASGEEGRVNIFLCLRQACVCVCVCCCCLLCVKAGVKAGV